MERLFSITRAKELLSEVFGENVTETQRFKFEKKIKKVFEGYEILNGSNLTDDYIKEMEIVYQKMYEYEKKYKILHKLIKLDEDYRYRYDEKSLIDLSLFAEGLEEKELYEEYLKIEKNSEERTENAFLDLMSFLPSKYMRSKDWKRSLKIIRRILPNDILYVDEFYNYVETGDFDYNPVLNYDGFRPKEKVILILSFKKLLLTKQSLREMCVEYYDEIIKEAGESSRDVKKRIIGKFEILDKPRDDISILISELQCGNNIKGSESIKTFFDKTCSNIYNHFPGFVENIDEDLFFKLYIFLLLFKEDYGYETSRGRKFKSIVRNTIKGKNIYKNEEYYLHDMFISTLFNYKTGINSSEVLGFVDILNDKLYQEIQKFLEKCKKKT